MWNRFKSKDWIGWIDAGFDSPSLRKILEQPEALQQQPGRQAILECAARRIHRFSLPEFPQVQLLGQYFQNPSLFRLWRPAAAPKLMRISRQLRKRDLLVPSVVASIRPRGSWWNRRSFAVMAELPFVYELTAGRGHQLPIHPLFPKPLEKLAAPLAATIARWHDGGIAHGDLKSRHVLVQSRDLENFDIYLADLERTMRLRAFPRPVREAYFLRDLVQLMGSLGIHATTSFRELFLEHYFRERKLSASLQRRFRRFLDLYRQGRLQQGRTLLEQLLGLRR